MSGRAGARRAVPPGRAWLETPGACVGSRWRGTGGLLAAGVAVGTWVAMGAADWTSAGVRCGSQGWDLHQQRVWVPRPGPVLRSRPNPSAALRPGCAGRGLLGPGPSLPCPGTDPRSCREEWACGHLSSLGLVEGLAGVQGEGRVRARL